MHTTELRGIRVCAAGYYEHEVSRAVLAFKNGGRLDALPVLSAGLARALRELCGDQSVLIVPVPSSCASVRHRGFSPALELSRTISSKDQPVADVVVRKREWVSQAAGQKLLGRSARKNRAHLSMRLAAHPLWWLGFKHDVRGRLCVIVDDVLTTGASMAEVKRVLEQAGARVLGGAVTASVPLKSNRD